MKRNLSIAVAFVIICSIASGYVYAEPVTASNFKDIKDTDWYAEAVVRQNKSDIINGLPGGLFSPKGEVTRAQFTKMLVQAMGYKKIDSISFDDIKPLEKGKAHWASVYIETALRNGVIVKDEIGDKFYPEVPIKREDMFTMMFRALKLATSEGDNPFYDIAEPNGMFTKLYEEYLVRGVVDRDRRLFMPQSLSTRAEAAVVIDRMLEYRDDPSGFVAKAGMKERFENGTQTAEDIALKRQIEIARAKADPNYIMEPIITEGRNEDLRNYRWFELYFDNYDDYSYDTKWKLEFINYKQLNNYEMPRPDGTFVKFNVTEWNPFGNRGSDTSKPCFYILGKNYYTTQALIKDFKLYPGMKIEFRVTVKKRLKERVVYKTVELQ